MDYFRIEGTRGLSGELTPMGNKNAALPLLAASILTDDLITLENVPDIGDVRTKIELLHDLRVDASLDSNTCRIDASKVVNKPIHGSLAGRIRTAALLAGPLLARFGKAEIGRPGGDRIGRRRLDTHLLALQALGADISVEADRYLLRTHRLKGCSIFLDEMSVTGTEQALLAAVLADGTTTISNAAMEPHVQDLCRCLNAMGARISGIATPDLIVEGVTRLHGSQYRIGPDYMEVGSLIGLAAATGSAIRIRDARPDEHRMSRIMFGRLGVSWQTEGNDIVVPEHRDLAVNPDFDGSVPKIDDMPWPGFPPDLVSIALVVATQSRGTTLIHQKMYDRRLVFADSLIEMGAGIVLCDPHRAIVLGPATLRGTRLQSPDIRAGMALVIAALAAEGTSTIHNVSQIDRGYENLELRLQSLNARIDRLHE